ncbi:MAG: DUF423 domain-containing protein [Bacteroidia bacterium]|nr:DUF423 domain-containing protein [Bacteroidia bacterium]
MNENSIKYSQFQKYALACAAFGLAIYVMLTALGAHALKEVLENPDLNRVFAAATKHLMLGCIGIFVAIFLSVLLSINTRIPVVLMLLGLLLFSLNLLVYFFLKINDIHIAFLGMLAPIGGTMFVLAWTWLGILIVKGKK